MPDSSSPDTTCILGYWQKEGRRDLRATVSVVPSGQAECTQAGIRVKVHLHRQSLYIDLERLHEM